MVVTSCELYSNGSLIAKLQQSDRLLTLELHLDRNQHRYELPELRHGRDPLPGADLRQALSALLTLPPGHLPQATEALRHLRQIMKDGRVAGVEDLGR
jgi:hypothetical protein